METHGRETIILILDITILDRLDKQSTVSTKWCFSGTNVRDQLLNSQTRRCCGPLVFRHFLSSAGRPGLYAWETRVRERVDGKACLPTIVDRYIGDHERVRIGNAECLRR